jgi:hypothetical protein
MLKIDSNKKVFLMYFALSVFFFGIPNLFDFVNKLPIGGDTAFFLWSFKWWPYAITHGLNPFMTDAFFAPYGQNLAWTGSVPSIAILFWPFTKLCGSIFSYNLANIIFLSTSTFCVYCICREFSMSPLSSIFGGCLFFFSSYIWSQLRGHLNLTAVSFVLFIVFIFILRTKRKIGQAKYITFCTLLLVFQFGVSIEIYASFLTIGFILIIIAFLIFRYDLVFLNKLWKTSIDTLISIACSIVLLSPYLYYLFRYYIEQEFNPSYFYSADMLNYFIPTRFSLIGGRLLINISTRFSGNIVEQGAYLGLPLVIIIIHFAYKDRKDAWSRYLIIAFIIVLVFSLGPYFRMLSQNVRLTFLGHKTKIYLPWFLFSKLPLIGKALPTRFTLYTSFLASLIGGLWFERTFIAKWKKYCLLFSALIFLIPNINVIYKGTLQIPEFFRSSTYKNFINPGENILVLPAYGQGGYQSPIWQAQTDFYFKTITGYAGLIPDRFMEYPESANIQKYFMGAPLPDKYESDFFSFLLLYNIKTIITTPELDKESMKLINALQVQPITVKGILVYKVDGEYCKSKYRVLKNENNL